MPSHFIFRFFSVLAFFLQTCKFVASENALINNICDQTDFPQFCRRALNSHPYSHSADLDGLTWISIELAFKNATARNDEIKQMKQSISNQTQLQSLEVCESKIEKVVNNLRGANLHWRALNYNGVSYIARESINEIQECNYQTPNGEYPLDGKFLNLRLLLKLVETLGHNAATHD